MAGYTTSTKSIYDENIDPQEYGSCFGLLRKQIAGGRFISNKQCGSRAVSCNSMPVRVEEVISARGCKENRVILGRQ